MNQPGRLDVCLIQEIKLSIFNLKTAGEFWGAKDVEWTHMDSIGASGGSFILWRKNSLELIQSLKDWGLCG